MDDDEVNTHEFDAKLLVGELEIASILDHVPAEILSVFTDDMSSADPDVVQFTAPGPVIADRLDMLGFTPARVHGVINELLDESRCLDDLIREYLPGHSEGRWPAVPTAREWIAAFRRTTGESGREEPEASAWLLQLITEAGQRVALRAVLLARPDDPVRLDITQPYRMGAIKDIEGLCTSGLQAIRAVASDHAPIIVLVEGRTDAEFLAAGLRLLYPHLVDLIAFMNFDHKPSGGAGELVKKVKALAAAGIVNRVVALFDNDSAAADSLRTWNKSNLPGNIRVRQYPSITLADDYPTLGPPPGDGRVANANVNELAGSIEMYLGRDVLTDGGGRLRPVQWKTYIPGMRRYQGEVTDKQTIQEAYRAKVSKAESNPSQMKREDWSDIDMILKVILDAFD